MPPPLTPIVMLTQWHLDWVALAASAAAVTWYLLTVRRISGTGWNWPSHRIGLFAAGAVLYLWCAVGWLGVYADTLLWVWSIHVLALLLVVPMLLMTAQPVALASATARQPSLLGALFNSRLGHLAAHPFVGPAVVPVLTGVLFFGHVSDLWTANSLVASGVGLLLVVVGCLIAAPFAVEDTGAASLAVGLALAVSVFELLTDAIPGIVLRLDTHLVTVHFAVRHAAWAMAPLADQHLAGSILWGVAEMLDLPFLFIMFLRWIHADEREARRAEAAHDGPFGDADTPVPVDRGVADAPWWLDDPQLRQRPGIAPPRRSP